MALRARRFSGLFAGLFLLAVSVAWHGAVAQDVVHMLSGVVKSVDKGTKTVVVAAADGTEQTIKYTDQTVVKGTKDTGKGVADASVDTYLAGKEGTKVTVKYTEKAGEKTAVGIKDASKGTAKAVSQ